MFKRFIKKPYYYLFTILFLFLVFIAVCYLLIKRVDKNHSETSQIERQIMTISDSFLFHPFYTLQDIWSIIKFNLFTRGIEVRNLAIDYERIKRENKKLKIENKKLSELIKYSPSYGKIIATGRILSDPNSFWGGAFTISVGFIDKVQFGDVVTSDRGIVGKVVKVFENISVVLPIRHLSSKLIGRVQGQDGIVLISGRNLQGGVIDYISDVIGLEKGQQIETVADGITIPDGIPIGTIIDPYEKPISIKFNVDFARLDYISIIRGGLSSKKTKDDIHKMTLNTNSQTSIKSETPESNSQNTIEKLPKIAKEVLKKKSVAE